MARPMPLEPPVIIATFPASGRDDILDCGIYVMVLEYLRILKGRKKTLVLL